MWKAFKAKKRLERSEVNKTVLFDKKDFVKAKNISTTKIINKEIRTYSKKAGISVKNAIEATKPHIKVAILKKAPRGSRKECKIISDIRNPIRKNRMSVQCLYYKFTTS